MKKNKFLIIIPLLIIIFSFFITGIKNSDVVENLEIISGIGVDIKCKTHNSIEYSSTYIFGEPSGNSEYTTISSTIRDGIGENRECEVFFCKLAFYDIIKGRYQ